MKRSGKPWFLGLKVWIYWDPMIRKLRDCFKSNRTIHIPHSERTDAILAAMKSSTRGSFAKRISAYEGLIEATKAHNRLVENSNAFKAWFSYEKILASPHSLDEAMLSRIQEGHDALESFQTRTSTEEKLLSQSGTILNFHEDICLQFDLWDALRNVRHPKADEYISYESADALKEKEQRLLAQSDGFDTLYYEFKEDPAFQSRIDDCNEAWLQEHAKDPLFDNVNGKSLDAEQRRAVLKNEKNSLVIAGAGSGKTLTICGKVKYLLEREGVSPQDILLLSFSKKSADDMQLKISSINADVKASTFHKTGLDILKAKTGKPFLVEEQFDAIVESYFREELKNRPEEERDVLNYYGLYLANELKQKEYEDEGELYEDLKGRDITTLKSCLQSYSKDPRGKLTIKKERVKSYEEMSIANWFFLNGVDYVYEAPYEYDVSTAEHRQYKPDFFLKKYGVYHEHYGINKDGKALQFGEEESQQYVAGMNWKKTLHAQYGTDCIETYSYDFQDGSIFQKLEEELKKRGIPVKPLSREEVSETMNSIYYGRPFSAFINLVKTFLALYKSRYPDESYFEKIEEKKKLNGRGYERAKLFLRITKRVYAYYMGKLREEGKIDFDDMIQRSTEVLDSMDGFRFRYILVDEFQDISYSRMIFLKKLMSHGNAKLFAVGDDWQSIYRFAGSDLEIFTRFGDYFGRFALSKITTTHRNSQELQDIVGPFIRENQEQIDKTITSSIHLDHPVKLMFYSAEKTPTFLDVLKDIGSKDPKAKVLVLGRNKKDFDSVALDEQVFMVRGTGEEGRERIVVPAYREMEIRYSTVHAAKGLEEDYVILINADDMRLGFPNKVEDDPLLSLVLSSESHFEFAEERRLWYVALTRTRKYVYIIADRQHPSLFIKEIISKCDVMNDGGETPQEDVLHCPRCKSGRLVMKRDSQGGAFYGCSNFPYCDYAIRDLAAVERNFRCPVCGDYMVLRKGKWGYFYGCHGYPYCTHVEK